MISLLEAALAYAAKGVPIFPCIPGTKFPLIKRSFYNASADPEQVREWWTATPDANIAFSPEACGECVVDVEHNGKTDWQDLLEDCVETVPPTRIVSTPSGGWHIYFKGSLPGKVRIKSPTGRELQIDTRGQGSYVLLPPSQFNGNTYEVINDAEPSPLPSFLTELVRSGTQTASIPDDVELDSPADIARARWSIADWIRRGRISIEGCGGDATLYGIACDLSDLGISEARCAELLSGEWDQACIPPWSTEPDHFARTISNAYQYQRNRGSGAHASRATFAGFDAKAFEAQRVGSGAIPTESSGSMGGDDGPGSDRSAFALLSEREQDELRDPGWLVPGVITMGATVLHAAIPKSYKTFIALDLSLGIAAGLPTFGVTPTIAGDVVYAALEGRVQIATKRRQAWRKARGIPDDKELPFWLTKAPRVSLDVECRAFLAVLDALVASGRTLALIVIDTLAKAMSGLNESNAEDGALLLTFVDGLRDRYGCAVYIVSHAGYREGEIRTRGSSAIPAGCDTLITSEADKNAHLVKVSVTAHKDAEDDDLEWHFDVRRAHGSLVLDHITKAEALARVRKADPYSLDKITAALVGLGAVGHPVSLAVLASVLTPHIQDESEESYQAQVDAAKKRLLLMAKASARPYVVKAGRETLWQLPEGYSAD